MTGMLMMAIVKDLMTDMLIAVTELKDWMKSTLMMAMPKDLMKSTLMMAYGKGFDVNTLVMPMPKDFIVSTLCACMRVCVPCVTHNPVPYEIFPRV